MRDVSDWMYVVGGYESGKIDKATTEMIKKDKNIITLSHLLPSEVDVSRTIQTKFK